MTAHESTLIVEGPDLQHESIIESLYQAGFDDAAVGRVGSIQYLDFGRRRIRSRTQCSQQWRTSSRPCSVFEWSVWSQTIWWR